ncbi:MAG: T9SS type A sorting domain-containing protein [Prevotellaceae bacterium]|jgi:hypothetical protein|nr:T9SS type A sorting domain-containing protein [Prevotellaceae bacterium]
MLRNEESVLLTLGKDITADFVNVYSASGILLEHQKIDNNYLSVKIPNQSGIYLIVVYGDNQQLFTQKIIRY